jgi:hypothetical protein
MTSMFLLPQAAFERPPWQDGAPTTIPGVRPERRSATPPGSPVQFNRVCNVSEPTLMGFLSGP